jgi:hypothetical protein
MDSVVVSALAVPTKRQIAIRVPANSRIRIRPLLFLCVIPPWVKTGLLIPVRAGIRQFSLKLNMYFPQSFTQVVVIFFTTFLYSLAYIVKKVITSVVKFFTTSLERLNIPKGKDSWYK